MHNKKFQLTPASSNCAQRASASPTLRTQDTPMIVSKSSHCKKMCQNRKLSQHDNANHSTNLLVHFLARTFVSLLHISEFYIRKKLQTSAQFLYKKDTVTPFSLLTLR
jgi:hypothetical protein